MTLDNFYPSSNETDFEIIAVSFKIKIKLKKKNKINRGTLKILGFF